MEWQAMEKANEALRLLGQSSEWAAARAFETEASVLSRELYQKMRQAKPSAGRKRGNLVWWSFPPPAEQPWSPQFLQEPAFVGERHVRFVFEPHRAGEKFDQYKEERDKDEADKNDTSGGKLSELVDNAEKFSPAKLLQTLEQMRRDAQADLVDADGADFLNTIDDLITFLHEPKLTPKAVGIYFRYRFGRDANKEIDSPIMAPWQDYVAFRRAVDNAGVHNTHFQVAEEIATEMEEFLKKYPKSRKREAAMARLAINVARLAHGHAGLADLYAKGPPAISGGQTIEAEGSDHEQLPAAREAVAAYEKEFPRGRYFANIRLWRGALAIDGHDWPTALRNLTATLDDPRQADQHLDAALNLGYAFLQLLDQPDQRGAIIDALEAQPAAQKRLWQFMHSETPGARLCCLEGFLREQF
jgi:hypothetical protein